MKKAIIIMLCTLLSIGLIGCNASEPEDPVKGFCAAMKSFDIEAMNTYVELKDKSLVDFHTRINSGSKGIPDYLVDYFKENAEKIEYEIINSQETEEGADVTVKILYVDASRVFEEAIKNCTLKMMMTLFSNATDEGFEAALINGCLQDAIDSIKTDTSVEIVTFKCIKKDNIWKIHYSPIETEYIMFNNLTKVGEQLSDSFLNLNPESEPIPTPEPTATPKPIATPKKVSTINNLLPEGLTAEEYFLDRKTILLIRFHNDLGEAVSIKIDYSLLDSNKNVQLSGTQLRNYFPPDGNFVAIFQADSPIRGMDLVFGYGKVRIKTEERNEAVSVESNRNSDNSITLHIQSNYSEGVSVEGNIFYLDTNGAIIGFSPFGCGFSDYMDYTIDSPAFEYNDFFVDYIVS